MSSWIRLACTALLTSAAFASHAQGVYPNNDGHVADLDNVRLTEIAEMKDQIGFRRSRHALTAGANAEVVVRYAATGDQDVLCRLVSNGVSYAEKRTAVSKGRGVLTLSMAVPSSAPTASYSWQLQLVARNAAWGTASVSRVESGVFVDPGQSGSGSIAADSDRFVYQGRIDRSGGTAQPVLHWYGSSVAFRFSGTSLKIRGGSASNGFGGYHDGKVLVAIDGDFANPKSLTFNGNDQTVSAVTGLTDGAHDAVLFKSEETDRPFTFRGVQLDSGRGLLRPEPLPTRKLDVYGDSVTSGGEANPRTQGYAPTLGRALGADTHIISKGGTGVAASFSNMATLAQYWNQLRFTNVFTVADSDPKWDFTTRQASTVLVAIGHNDQFNGGGPLFPAAYQSFLTKLHGVYPNAHLFSANTLIASPDQHWQKAVEPVLNDDAKLHFRMQWTTWNESSSGHPPADAHQAMVNGATQVFSLAEWIEDAMGWGISGGALSDRALVGDGPGDTGNGTTMGSATNQLSNPGFEANGGATQTPSNWMEWSNWGGTGASFVETLDPRSGTSHLSHWRSAGYNAYTFQQLTSLSNGTYRLRAWVKGGGSFDSVNVQVKDQNTGTSLGWLDLANRLGGSYAQVELNGITVANGRAEIGIWSQSGGTGWLRIDDVEFVRTGN
jgi:hypothetical protein